MSQESPFLLRERNPDVLTSIANLSNDEVFTPPTFANQMLDTVAKAWVDSNDGANIWANKNVRFLDPFTKSGVFLREIVRRLSEGLEKEIPDLQDRINHIVSKQVFGIAITELTALTTRRSVYCSKRANGKHSIATIFNDEEGSIWFKRTEHTWTGGAQKIITVDENGEEIEKKLGGKCKHCGASQSEYERDKTLESHAYALIHTEDPKQLIKEVFGEEMQFDVIIGNPPYQLNDGGGEGSSAIPLYHHFVEQAIKLEPRLLTMIIPARWYSGGKGLDNFRQNMMSDKKLALINDYPETDLVFPGQNIRGGICVFLRNEAHEGPATITNFKKNGPPDVLQREISIPGVPTFVRYNKAISILEKVRKLGEQTLDTLVLSRNPFGIPSNFSAFSTNATVQSNILLYRSRRGSSADKEVYISPKQVGSGLPLIDKIKVLVSKASPGGDEYPHAVIGQPIIAGKNTASTETYLVVSTVNSIQEGSFLASYMSTRFFRFLVSLIKNTQNISKGSFAFVPVQKLDQHWTDQALYKKYGITGDEIEFIESLVRPKEVIDE